MQMTITLGNVLQIVATIVTIAMAYGRLAERLVRLEVKVDEMWERRFKSRD